MRHWRIVVGPWLYYFLHILYDRYLSIDAAAASGLVTGSLVCTEAPEQWVTRDMGSFIDVLLDDGFNQYVYSRLIRENGTIPYTPIEGVQRSRTGSHDRIRAVTKRAVRNALAFTSRWLLGGHGQIVIVSPYMRRRDRLRLELSLRQRPYFVTPKIVARDVPVNFQQRATLALPETGTAFERMAAKLIPELMPKSYIEEYWRMRRRSLRAFPPEPAGIFTSIAYSSDEGFKLWAAECVEKGVPLLVGQHGGHYGTGRWSGTEEHEFRIADRYYTWGWSGCDQPKAKPMPCVKVRSIGRVRPGRADGPVLWVMNSFPRYAYHLRSIPVGPQATTYLREQERFYRSLPSDVKKELMLRLYPKDYGWHEKQRWLTGYPGLKLAKSGRSLRSLLRGSRMVVVTYNTTTLLECFAVDYPTLLYWNPSHWELRESAQPFYDALKSAGILHDTPEAAASRLQDVYRAPRAWWASEPVRRAKKAFCDEFVRNDGGWLQVWRRELLRDVGQRSACGGSQVPAVPVSSDPLPNSSSRRI